MTINVCRECGEPFEGWGNQRYCKGCRRLVTFRQNKKARQRTKSVLIKKCIDCGQEFEAQRNIMRCEACRSDAAAVKQARYFLRQRLIWTLFNTPQAVDGLCDGIIREDGEEFLADLIEPLKRSEPILNGLAENDEAQNTKLGRMLLERR